MLLVFRFLHGEAAAVDGAEQAVPPSVDHAADGAGLPIAFAPATCGLAAIGSAGVALTQLLDACELFGRVGGREEAVLDAAALGLRGAVFRCSGRRMLSRGVMLKAGSFLLLHSSIIAVVSIRVFEQVVQ